MKQNHVFITGSKNRDHILALQLTISYQHKKFPITYLGCPLYLGRKTRRLFDSMIKRLHDRLAGWRGSLAN